MGTSLTGSPTAEHGTHLGANQLRIQKPLNVPDKLTRKQAVLGKGDTTEASLHSAAPLLRRRSTAPSLRLRSEQTSPPPPITRGSLTLFWPWGGVLGKGAGASCPAMQPLSP